MDMQLNFTNRQTQVLTQGTKDFYSFLYVRCLTLFPKLENIYDLPLNLELMYNIVFIAVWYLLICWLGAGAVEFVINHAEVSIAFAEEKKIPEVHLLPCLNPYFWLKFFLAHFVKIPSHSLLSWYLTRSNSKSCWHFGSFYDFVC